LRGTVILLQERLEDAQRDSADVIGQLREQVAKLEEMKKEITRSRMNLSKRCHRLQSAKAALKKRMAEMRKKQPFKFKMMKKGCYTPQMRSLARVMVSAGAAEAKVGAALVEISKAVGVTMERQMSRRTVGRCVLERGVAADIQLVYEILKSGSECFLSYQELTMDLGYLTRCYI
jgi:predicted  nucleic acid-binding Zn-ribbon protein